MDTYKSQKEKQDDKIVMTELLAALDAAKTAFALDECGAWRITGSRGHIYSKYTLYLRCTSARAWSAAKKKLAFCEITQDGDDEGCFSLERLPNFLEAREIREALGIRKRRPPPVNAFGG